ncbi:MAG: alpha-L-rhamnosidase [Bacteroidia bacterium]
MLVSLLWLGCTPTERPNPPQALRCEYAAAPLGIETPRPRFSWQIQDGRRGAVQTAYEIVLATAREDLQRAGAAHWHSGKVSSDQSVFVTYDGAALRPGTRYYWQVRTWDAADQASDFSSPAWFETGLMGQAWPADWIGAPDSMDRRLRLPHDLALPPSVLLRKTFTAAAADVRQAQLYVSARGGYVATLNGQRVTDALLNPGWTHYPKRQPYQVYDVTAQVRSGDNALGLVLGNLWWSSGLGWNGSARYDTAALRGSAFLVLHGTDGQTDTLRTDASWQVAPSPIVENTLYHGEHYDARKAPAGWDQPTFDATGWRAVQVFERPAAQMHHLAGPPIRITETLRPRQIVPLGADTFIVDFGQNMVGRARLRVSGPAGTRVQLRFGEILQPNGRLYTENLRKARATDSYTLRGEGEEVWAPDFTYHGFRYVEVTGYPGTPESSSLTGEVFHSDVAAAGTFSADQPLLEQLHRNIDWGLRGNLHSVPTDCPQRDERLGWMGDAQAFAPTACYLRDMNSFLAKWMDDITDSQHARGYVYDVNPAIVVDGPAKPAWGDAVVIVPWVLYQFYGDERVIEEHYAGMKAWVEYMRGESENNIYVWRNENNDWFGYGDWVAPVASDGKLIGSVHYYRSTDLLARMAAVIGQTEDARTYAALARDIAAAVQQTYFDAATNWYTGQTQTGQLLPLAFGLVPDSLAPSVLRHVASDVLARGTHLSTGFLGTPLLLPMLSDYDQHELAYRLATQTTYPSWGYMAEKGATTIWELWNSDTEGPGMNSRNHFALGAVGEWYYSHLAGLRPGEPGFKHSHIAPMPVRDLPAAAASYTTPYGSLASQWRWEGDNLHVEVTIPPNTTATLLLPTEDPLRTTIYEADAPILSGGKPASLPPYLQVAELRDDAVELRLGAGTYNFVVKVLP